MATLVRAELKPLDCYEIGFRRKALRDAIICIGWLKLISVVFYFFLYFVVYANSTGSLAQAIHIMILTAIVPQLILGLLLFFGALQKYIWALDAALWMCLIIAAYNTVLGGMGAIYFLRYGNATMHFILSVIFIFLAISIFAVICHDVIIIYAYKKILISDEENS